MCESYGEYDADPRYVEAQPEAHTGRAGLCICTLRPHRVRFDPILAVATRAYDMVHFKDLKVHHTATLEERHAGRIWADRR